MKKNSSKKLVLLKTYYYRAKNQEGKTLANSVIFKTDPLTSSDCSIFRMTDKNFNPIEDKNIEYKTMIIPSNNPSSGITSQYFDETVMIKTKNNFVSGNTIYADASTGTTTTVRSVDFPVTASSGKLKNAVLIRVEYDNDGNIFSNGVKFARRVSIFGYK
jgi:hypothetical protein